MLLYVVGRRDKCVLMVGLHYKTTGNVDGARLDILKDLNICQLFLSSGDGLKLECKTDLTFLTEYDRGTTSTRSDGHEHFTDALLKNHTKVSTIMKKACKS